MGIKLKPFYSVYDIIQSDEKTYTFSIGASNRTHFEIKGDESFLYLLSILDGTKKVEDIKNIIMDKFGNSEMEITQTLNDLIENNIIFNINEEEDHGINNDRYSRHLSFYSMFDNDYNLLQKRVASKKVMLIGMGGIGCWILPMLASSGIRNIIAVDSDIIELSNLTRQILYKEADVGKSKLIVAKEWINRFNSEIDFKMIDRNISQYEDLHDIIQEDIDLVILSADTPYSLVSLVHNACKEKKVSYVQIGYMDDEAICGPLVTDFNFDITRLVPKDNEGIDSRVRGYIDRINSRTVTPSYGPLNAYISTFAGLQIIKFLADLGDVEILNKRYIFNFFDNSEKLIDYLVEDKS